MYALCQLCSSEPALSNSPIDELLCYWCRPFVKQKRKEGMTDKEIIIEFKNHPRYLHTKGMQIMKENIRYDELKAIAKKYNVTIITADQITITGSD